MGYKKDGFKEVGVKRRVAKSMGLKKHGLKEGYVKRGVSYQKKGIIPKEVLLRVSYQRS